MIVPLLSALLGYASYAFCFELPCRRDVLQLQVEPGNGGLGRPARGLCRCNNTQAAASEAVRWL